MSFSIEFYAQTADHAQKTLDQESNLPQSVRDFLSLGLKATQGPVYVKAYGHLYHNDYTTSSAALEVRPIYFVPTSTSS